MALKLTSWNILAHVWADPSLYPKISVPLLDKAARRRIVAARMREFDSDVMHLQEVEKEELDAIRSENPDLEER
jgi:mRNA deadenylase 3'-5' endonuclease subunit Ccr4